MTVLCQLLASRKFWIALTAVVADVCVVFGADASKWTHLILSISGIAGVLITAIAQEDAAALNNPSNNNNNTSAGDPPADKA